MHHENTSLRATISRQSQKIGRIENELRKNELLLKDQGDLQSTVEKQREKIVQYQREIEETKLHMARLEELVHQVQEQSMKEHVTATPSVSMIDYPGIWDVSLSVYQVSDHLHAPPRRGGLSPSKFHNFGHSDVAMGRHCDGLPHRMGSPQSNETNWQN